MIHVEAFILFSVVYSFKKILLQKHILKENIFQIPAVLRDSSK